MPVITKPEKFIYENNVVIKGTNLLVDSEGNLPSAKDIFSIVSEKFALDWFSEDLYKYNAVLLKDDAEIPAHLTLCPMRRFFWTKAEQTFIAARARSLLKQRQTYKFCPTCGTKFEDDKTESALFCPHCNVKFFPRIEPATITLISRGDEILLARGKNGTYHKFACISGFVEQGENLEQCVVREVKEETNLNIKNLKYTGSRSWPFPDQLMLEFTADYESGELKIQESELLEARWFKRDELPPLEELPEPGSSAHTLIFGNANK